MNTLMLSNNDDDISIAAKLINEGEVVGIPTETVYGLGANAFDENAVRKIFKAKGRPADNPLIVHICDFDMIYELVDEIPELAKKCAERFMPGPITMVLKKSDKIPLVTSGGLDTVGIRMPANVTARKIIKASGVPIAAPSANLSGSPSPTSAEHVFNDMNGRISAIVDDGNCSVGVESTVICFENDGIRILRPGFVTPEDLREITDNIYIDKGVLEKIQSGETVRSPGMKYKHYAPKGDIVIVSGDRQKFKDFILNKKSSGENFSCMVFDDDDCMDINVPYICYGSSDKEQAKNLFDVLRKIDELGWKKIYARCPEKSGVGLAVYNRLIRAAAFRVINL